MIWKYNRIVLLLLFVLFLPQQGWAGQVQDRFTLLLPAPALLESIQSVLPFPLPLDGPNLAGTIRVDSVESLTIHDGMISLHAVLSGQHLAMKTKIAGQNITLKLGQLLLPLEADLRLRFDREAQRILVTPQITSPQGEKTRNNEAAALLLAALGHGEYPIPLGKLLVLNSILGGHHRPLSLELVEMTTKENQLLLRFRSQTGKRR